MERISNWLGNHARILVIIVVLAFILNGAYSCSLSQSASVEDATATTDGSDALGDVPADYDPTIDEVGHRIAFGEGAFYLEGNTEDYVEDGVLDFRRMADDYGHIDDIYGDKEGELSADRIPESGSHIAVHGATSDSDRAYIDAWYGTTSVRFDFTDAPEDRTLALEDGSRISALCADTLHYVFETIGNHPSRTRVRFLHLEKFSTADAKLVVRCAETATWDDIENTDIALKGELFPLRQTAYKYGFLAESPIEGGGVAYRRYSEYGNPVPEIRVYGSWNGEPAYFEAQELGSATFVWMSFEMSGEDVVTLEDGSKIPELMARTITFALDCFAHYSGYFEERFDALTQTAPEGVIVAESVELVSESVQAAVTENGDGWISTQANLSNWKDEGQLNLRAMAEDLGWRVAPAMAGEMTILPTKNTFGYAELASYNIRVYGNQEYGYVLLSGPWYRIMVEFEGFAESELVQLDNGCTIPERAGWVVLKAIESLNNDQRTFYGSFEQLKETAPKGVKITMNSFS